MARNPSPAKVGDFYVFPVALPVLPSFPHEATHYFYIRPHQPKIPNAVTPRSLFLVNIPIDSTEVHLKHLFSTQLGLGPGKIAEVQFLDEEGPERTPAISSIGFVEPPASAASKSKKRKRGSSVDEAPPPLDPLLPPAWDRTVHKFGTNAVLVFVDRRSMELALYSARRARKETRKIVWGEGIEGKVPALGSQRYLRHSELLFPDRSILLAHVDQYMTAFNAQTAARERLLSQQRQAPGADGFVTVTRSASKAGVKGVKQEAAKQRLQKQQDKQEGLTNFYRFQGREKAKERERELRMKFEEDREQVRKMRERKKNTIDA